VVLGVLIGTAGIVLLVEGHTTLAKLRPVGGAALVIGASVSSSAPGGSASSGLDRRPQACTGQGGRDGGHVPTPCSDAGPHPALVRRRQHVVPRPGAGASCAPGSSTAGPRVPSTSGGRHHVGRGRPACCNGGSGGPRHRGAGGHGGLGWTRRCRHATDAARDLITRGQVVRRTRSPSMPVEMDRSCSTSGPRLRPRPMRCPWTVRASPGPSRPAWRWQLGHHPLGRGRAEGRLTSAARRESE
jgi:hypothetical protein